MLKCCCCCWECLRQEESENTVCCPREERWMVDGGWGGMGTVKGGFCDRSGCVKGAGARLLFLHVDLKGQLISAAYDWQGALRNVDKSAWWEAGQCHPNRGIHSREERRWR